MDGKREGIREDIKRWRERAEESRKFAEQFRDPSAQKTLREIADLYDRLANDAEAGLT